MESCEGNAGRSMSGAPPRAGWARASCGRGTFNQGLEGEKEPTRKVPALVDTGQGDRAAHLKAAGWHI